MNRLIGLLVVVVIAVTVLGFYREWFRFDSEKADGKANVTLSVDTDKIRQDGKSAVEGAQGLGHKTEKAVAPVEDRD